MPKIRCIHCETSFVTVRAVKKHETTCPLKQLSWLFSDPEQFTKEVEKRKEIFQKEKSKRENEKRSRKEYMRKYMRKYRESKEEKNIALELLQLKHAPKEKRIGVYTIPERKALLARYRAKRKRRVFVKKTTYPCRQVHANNRRRCHGRFVVSEAGKRFQEGARKTKISSKRKWKRRPVNNYTYEEFILEVVPSEVPGCNRFVKKHFCPVAGCGLKFEKFPGAQHHAITQHGCNVIGKNGKIHIAAKFKCMHEECREEGKAEYHAITEFRKHQRKMHGRPFEIIGRHSCGVAGFECSIATALKDGCEGCKSTKACERCSQKHYGCSNMDCPCWVNDPALEHEMSTRCSKKRRC